MSDIVPRSGKALGSHGVPLFGGTRKVEGLSFHSENCFILKRSIFKVLPKPSKLEGVTRSLS